VTFIELWRKGKVYLATRPNNYDWASGTTIADAEILYEDLPADLVYMRFGAGIVIASTRPELLCACRAVIVNPNDARYTGMIGSKVRVPIFGNEVEIIAHPSAQTDFGSGAVMICSYGDHNDVALFRELKLKEVVAIGMDGRMTGAAGAYAGLRPKQARAKIIQDLESGGHTDRVERITHRTPVSERSKVPIEIIPMEDEGACRRDPVSSPHAQADTAQLACVHIHRLAHLPQEILRDGDSHMVLPRVPRAPRARARTVLPAMEG
jgi:valyl-tRNA synthetase